MFYEFKNAKPNPYLPDVLDVSPEEVYKNSTELYLVDVREDSEFTGELGHAPKATLVNLAKVPESLSSFPRDKTIIFICRSGGRSSRAAQLAKLQGFSHVYNMEGGMLLWNDLELPTET